MNCPICDSTNIDSGFLKFWYGLKEYSIGKCLSCTGLFYRTEFFFDFKENFEHNRSLKIYIEKTSDIEESITIMHNFFANYPSRTMEGIDVGCGVGLLMDFSATMMGRKVLGFEPSTHYSKEGKKILGLEITEDFFSPDMLAGKKIDYVVCFQVVQLVPNPITLVTDLKSILKQAGILFLSTPDTESIGSGAGAGEHHSALSPGVHRVLFNERSLRELLLRAGFKHQEIFKRNGQLFAIASDETLGTFDLFASARQTVVQYYVRKLVSLPGDTSYFRGIWYRLYRNHIDHGEYVAAMTMLQDADWFELWSVDDIVGIHTLDKLYELNSSGDAIIYYYTGILFLNHLQKQEYAEKFFFLSFLLCCKIIEIQPDMSAIERDIVWLAKIHQVLVQIYKGKNNEATTELMFILSYNSGKSGALPPPSSDILSKAAVYLNQLKNSYDSKL